MFWQIDCSAAKEFLLSHSCPPYWVVWWFGGKVRNNNCTLHSPEDGGGNSKCLPGFCFWAEQSQGCRVWLCHLSAQDNVRCDFVISVHMIMLGCDFVISVHMIMLGCDFVTSVHMIMLGCDFVISVHMIMLGCDFVTSVHMIMLGCDFVISVHMIMLGCDFVISVLRTMSGVWFCHLTALDHVGVCFCHLSTQGQGGQYSFWWNVPDRITCFPISWNFSQWPNCCNLLDFQVNTVCWSKDSFSSANNNEPTCKKRCQQVTWP